MLADDQSPDPVRAHVRAAAKQGNEDAIERLAIAEPPPGVRYLFDWFWQLKGACASGWSSTVITFTEIDAWARQYKRNMYRWELDAIRAMDLALNSTIKTANTKT